MSSELIAGTADLRIAAFEPGVPRPARVDVDHAGDLLVPVGLGLALESPRTTARVGAWYAARDNPGVYVSVLQPGLIAKDVLESSPRLAGRLDEVEGEALTYLVAFDLSRFEVDFSVGTDHPRVGWSDRARPEMRDTSLPGPDGIGDITPLVAGGMIPYSLAERTVASFAGGFKRAHGAFKTGALARRQLRQPLRVRRGRRRPEHAAAGPRHALRARRRQRGDEDLEPGRRRPPRAGPLRPAERRSPSRARFRGPVRRCRAPSSDAGVTATGPARRTPGSGRSAPVPVSRSGAAGASSSSATSPAPHRPRWRASSRPSVPLRHAPRHERPGAHLPGALPGQGRDSRRAPGRGHGRPRQGRGSGTTMPRFLGVRRQPGFFYLVKRGATRPGSRSCRSRHTTQSPNPTRGADRGSAARLVWRRPPSSPRSPWQGSVRASDRAEAVTLAAAEPGDVRRSSRKATALTDAQMDAVRRHLRPLGLRSARATRRSRSTRSRRTSAASGLGEDGPRLRRPRSSRRSAAAASWRRSTTRRARPRSRREPASTSSSSPASRASSRSSGCARARPPSCARRSARRLCDAHEWEGACAGAPAAARLPLRPCRRASLPRRPCADARRAQPGEPARKTWCYGPLTGRALRNVAATRPRAARAAAGTGCGSNTFPAGSFPACRSPLGVFDLHGNAAEHMNLPLDASQMASRGSGSWGDRDEGKLVHLRPTSRRTRTGAAGALRTGTAAGSWTRRATRTTTSAFAAAERSEPRVRSGPRRRRLPVPGHPDRQGSRRQGAESEGSSEDLGAAGPGADEDLARCDGRPRSIMLRASAITPSYESSWATRGSSTRS